LLDEHQTFVCSFDHYNWSDSCLPFDSIPSCRLTIGHSFFTRLDCICTSGPVGIRPFALSLSLSLSLSPLPPFHLWSSLARNLDSVDTFLFFFLLVFFARSTLSLSLSLSLFLFAFVLSVSFSTTFVRSFVCQFLLSFSSLSFSL
jgi:hypothetical protein